MNSRQKQILALLHTSDQSIRSLASRFEVTEMTVRRDLKVLSDYEGVIVSRGQAMLYDKLQKSSEDAETEAAAVVRANIAEALYHRIFPAETLFLSGGRTTLAFARYLATHCVSPVTVVTNSLAIASTLFCGNSRNGAMGQCKVILLGGELRTDQMDLMGAVAEKNLREYYVEWLVTGCDAADSERGFFTSDLSVSNLERESVKIADHVAVVTQSTKFSMRALAKFADFSDIDLLVTDDNLPSSVAERIEQRGLEVIRANSEEEQDLRPEARDLRPGT